MKKIKLKPFKPQLPKGTVYVSVSPMTYDIWAQERYEKAAKARQWKLMLASLTGETVDDEWEYQP